MTVNKNRPAQSQNEPHEIITFQFSESKEKIRNIFINGEPRFIGSDVAKALGYKNVRKAMKDHCKGVTKCYILTNGGNQLTNVIPESDVYRLIIKSTLPKAQEFERWLMEDLLPNLRKKGYYAMNHKKNDDFIDARNVPYMQVLINEQPVRVIELEKTKWFSINDYHTAINSRTSSSQTAKKLNVKETLAKKIQLFGNTHPAWFTTELGLQLIASGSRIMKSNQLNLPL